jgi:hypothetical protein
LVGIFLILAECGKLFFIPNFLPEPTKNTQSNLGVFCYCDVLPFGP